MIILDSQVRFRCSVCGMTRSMTLEGARLWLADLPAWPIHETDNGQMLPDTKECFLTIRVAPPVEK